MSEWCYNADADMVSEQVYCASASGMLRPLRAFACGPLMVCACLKTVSYTHLDVYKRQGQVKCIYIDPPYNTGNENWVYNDNVNDPKIKKWLGEVVGKEGEDLTRHDKWLCMMYPRLKLLQKLLAEDGCLIISIGHHELNNLVTLLREIFGSKQIVTITVQTSGGKPSGGFNYVHEYLIFVVPMDFHANALDF